MNARAPKINHGATINKSKTIKMLVSTTLPTLPEPIRLTTQQMRSLVPLKPKFICRSFAAKGSCVEKWSGRECSCKAAFAVRHYLPCKKSTDRLRGECSIGDQHVFPNPGTVKEGMHIMDITVTPVNGSSEYKCEWVAGVAKNADGVVLVNEGVRCAGLAMIHVGAAVQTLQRYLFFGDYFCWYGQRRRAFVKVFVRYGTSVVAILDCRCLFGNMEELRSWKECYVPNPMCY